MVYSLIVSGPVVEEMVPGRHAVLGAGYVEQEVGLASRLAHFVGILVQARHEERVRWDRALYQQSSGSVPARYDGREIRDCCEPNWEQDWVLGIVEEDCCFEIHRELRLQHDPGRWKVSAGPGYDSGCCSVQLHSSTSRFAEAHALEAVCL